MALLGVGGVILAAGGFSRVAYGFAGVAIALGLIAFAFLVPYFLLPGRPEREQTGRRSRAPIFIANLVVGFALVEFFLIWILRTRH